MNRTDVLNHLAEKYQLKRYLEIGVQVPELNFDKIKCEDKTGVDPDMKAHANYPLTSDMFFSLVDNEKLIGHWWRDYDLIFIDGFHTAEQVRKDFENALKILSPNGFIVLHDCNPEKEEHTIVPRPTKTGHWNGDVWKFAANISNSYSFTVDIDNGCRVFSAMFSKNDIVALCDDYTWEYFDKNRKQLLNLISWDEFVKL